MTIAVLAAMSMEAAPLLRRMENPSGKQFLCGTIGQAQVVLHICGAGMRRAANGAKALIEKYHPDLLVNYGVSGGLMPGLHVGDTVIVTSSCPASGKAYRTEPAVPTDAALADFASQALPHAIQAPAATSLGILVNKQRKARLVAKTGAVCIDTETYAIAKTARALAIPLLVLRCLSDTVEPASLLRFFQNGAMAAEKIAADVEAVLKALMEA
ncbi:MAG: 5'-methylthioadenosine/S-adenosylhomocysteine nucleosidase [Oscillospiraceae bacterium]|nr:5'-methylthioadenosine/S-adenosylhomocysteine nucleosidase [Oscillospiraceae bacterium]